MALAYIYALHDPRDWSMRYVGKTKNPERRLRDHMTRRSHSRSLQRFINELRALGIKPRLTILCECSAEQSAAWERFWISTVRAVEEKLVNIKFRAWNKGRTLSAEYRKKLSDAHKGVKLSPEHIANAARAAIGRKHPPRTAEARAKMRAAKLGKKQSLKHRANVSAALKLAWANPEIRKRILTARAARR
jgi:hypothetical protein